MSSTYQSLSDVNLADRNFWLRKDRDDVFTRMRAAQPISWQEGTDWVGKGFWALTRHADIVEASKNPETFSSVNSIYMADKPEVPPERRVFESMINADDPEHMRLRKLVSQGFTPRVVRQLETSVRERARAIVD